MKLANFLRLFVVGLAGVVAAGMLAFQQPGATTAGDPVVKRDEDGAQLTLVAEDDDDDDRDTRSRASRNTGADNSRTGARASGRDDSRSGRRVKDWTRDGKNNKVKRDWSQNQTNDRSRRNTR